ncbi:prephenate dehydrogenase [Rhizobium sp.]|jgi:prephenate dehydrogenase|uniref:prephenate dehydrogenase n=1 Tax=Rhizobium sp. TaxID=391 RepID=UPI000E926DCD|nr:prephenate dehydrogenase/arogenate dehydrogenase family protein [Rhizobium sp.]
MQVSSVGIVGFGAIGKLIALHLCPHFHIHVYDIREDLVVEEGLIGVAKGDVKTVASCDVVVLAVPVNALPAVAAEVRAYLKPGAIVFDVSSVKAKPAIVMQTELPCYVDIIGTHPLFGPQSAGAGIRGLKIAVCPIRTKRLRDVVAFLRRRLGLRVFVVTPEEHDSETAITQGLTHLIARVLADMGPLPDRLSTASFDLLMHATNMVRYDSNAVFLAIHRTNPYSAAIRKKFIELTKIIDSLIIDGECVLESDTSAFQFDRPALNTGIGRDPLRKV